MADGRKLDQGSAPSDDAPLRRSASSPPPVLKKRVPGFVVDEEQVVVIPQGIGFVTFRPGQRLDDPYMLALAREHDIAIREK